MNEDQLNEEIKTYANLSAEDKNVDAAALAAMALQNANENQLPANQKRWAYFVAFAVPPLGLVAAAWFYVSGKSDARQAAVICIVLTVLSILLFVLIFNSLLSGSGQNFGTIQQIDPNQLQQLLQ